MAIHKLNALMVDRLKGDGRYNDGGGLYLQIDGGSRSWLLRFKRNGRSRQMGLGAFPDVGLADARQKAADARALLAAGKDPIDVRDAERTEAKLEAAKALTFDECKDSYIGTHKAAWKNKTHRKQWKNSLATYASPVLGKLPISMVNTTKVMEVLKPIWTEKPETASRLRGRIERIIAWATVQNFRTGENPARWRGHLDQLLPPIGRVRRVKHHPAMPFEDVPAFMAELRTRKGVAAKALYFLILTAVRTGDIIGNDRDDRPPMRWEHVNLTPKVWTIPGTKTDSEHRVPLSPEAFAVLKEMKALGLGTSIVFPSLDRVGEPLSNNSMLSLLERMGHGDLTVHGFRSSFRDWAAERTNFQNHVVEMALAHAIDDKVEAAYRRGDLFEKRRRLMEAWAKFATGKPAVVGSNVIALAS